MIFFHSFQHGVQNNEGPCSPHTSTAVDQEGLGVTQRMSIADSMSEIDEGHSIRGYSVIRPGGVVELSHLKGWGRVLGGLWILWKLGDSRFK